MDRATEVEEAVELLQQLGLKEYEARCFVGLTQFDTGTAKSLSETTQVPRTRVYEAVKVLEAKGLVEIQHQNPQQFRAVDLQEATRTLSAQYQDRIDRLGDVLSSLERLDHEQPEAPVQEVWSLSGTNAVEQRARQLIEDAEEEILLIMGEDRLLTDALLQSLEDVPPEVDLRVGTLSADVNAALRERLPNATTFLSSLESLRAEPDGADSPEIGRLLMVDGSTMLVSTVDPGSEIEQAIFGDGFGNGVVLVARRLLASGSGLTAETD
jgi:sugar-specific transcriptional regulator TrmB